MYVFGINSGAVAVAGFACIPGIIFGHIGLRKTKNDPTQGGRGMAIAGTVIGYAIPFTLALLILFLAFLVVFTDTFHD